MIELQRKSTGRSQPAMLSRAELETRKTKYAVVGEGWVENYLGHGQHYGPLAEGEETRVVELLPEQAEYYLMSHQVAPIPGETRGHPADAQTGEALDLDAETRRKIQQSPGIASTGEQTAVLSGDRPSEESAEVVSQQGPSTLEEAAGVTSVDQASDPVSKTRRSGR